MSAGRAVSPLVSVQWALANAIVLRKLHAALGLDRLRFFVSGGAALPRETGEFFHSVGLVLLEGYGLTETSPVVSVNRPERFKLGTIGPPAPGVEVRIGDAGEILVRGPNVMQGYHNKPEDTAAAFTADGWFRTGDVGTMDDDGYITITDRLKDLLVLANGKNVAPQPIEGLLKASPYISQAVVLGDGKQTVTALIVPTWERLRDWAAHSGMDLPEDRAAIAANADVRKLMRAEIARVTADLAEYEKVTRFTLLDHELTVEDGQLTPTLKVRRKVVLERYAREIAAMYPDSQA
jgi:long-chain acyl-CoA synthetase